MENEKLTIELAHGVSPGVRAIAAIDDVCKALCVGPDGKPDMEYKRHIIDVLKVMYEDRYR